MVAMDTVRWDRTNLAGYDRDTTPNLAAFAALPGSVVFSKAYTDAAWSQPAYASLFTGQDALTHGVGFRTAELADGQATLTTMLKAAGYETRAWVSGPHLAPITGINRGFDTYDHDLSYKTLGASVQPAVQWLTGTSDRPRFAFIHGYDAHGPYPTPALLSEHFSDQPHDQPQHCRGKYWRCHQTEVTWGRGPPLPDPEQHQLNAAYDAAVAFADHQLGRILYSLQEAGRLDHTLVIVFSDHGEMLGEDGWLGHAHGHSDSVFHVPLVVRLPTASTPGRPAEVDRVVSLSDLLPTVASRLDMSPPAGAEGTPIPELLDPPSPGTPTVHRAASQCCFYVRDGDWTLKGMREETGWRWTLHRGDDQTDRRAEEPERHAALLATLGDWPQQTYNPRAISEKLGTQSAALKEALKSGGYWSGAKEGGQ